MLVEGASLSTFEDEETIFVLGGRASYYVEYNSIMDGSQM